MNQPFVFLDDQADKRRFLNDIKLVRKNVLSLAEQVPIEEHYTPRYGDWTLAAMLAHLQTSDTAALWLVKASANGFRYRVPAFLVDPIHNTLMRLFQRRLVRVTMQGLRKKEAEIVTFIDNLPIDCFSSDVHHPGQADPYTVEQAVQVYFLHHWQEHLAIMQKVEGVTGKE